MAKIDFEKQQEEIARMRAELDRLNIQFEKTCKAAGIDPDAKIETDSEPVPAEVRRAMNEAAEEARRAGRQAAASLEADKQTAAAPSRRARRGAIAI